MSSLNLQVPFSKCKPCLYTVRSIIKECDLAYREYEANPRQNELIGFYGRHFEDKLVFDLELRRFIYWERDFSIFRQENVLNSSCNIEIRADSLTRMVMDKSMIHDKKMRFYNGR